MIRLLSGLSALILMLFLNCASAEQPTISPVIEASNNSVESGLGTLYLYRNQFQASAAPVKLLIDDNELGWLEGNSNIRIDLPRGSHSIKAIIHGSTPSELVLSIDTGKVYFAKHQIKLLYIYSLILVPEEIARNEINKTKTATPIVINLDRKDAVVIRNNLRYEGFSDALNLNGHGRIVYPENSPVEYYQGEIYKGKPSGKGILIEKSGNEWQGYFSNGEIRSGELSFKDGGVYQGEFASWKIHGKGKLTTSDLIANGVFKENKFYSGTVTNIKDEFIAKFVSGKVERNSVSNSESANSTLSNILNFSISAASVILQSYNNSIDARIESQNEQINNSENEFSISTSKASPKLDTTSSRVNENSCNSDFQCGVGKVCVKKRYTNEGVCMKSVDSDGMAVYNGPDTESIGVRTSEGCKFNSDCSVGFVCDETYKVCVKR